jgi:hypothetical protein
MFGLLLVPLFIGGILFYFFRSITWKEFLVQIGGSALLLTAAYFIAQWGALRDTEYLNGVVTKKASGTESCCHCHDVCTSTDKNGNCTAYVEVCSHNHDYWWSLKTTVGSIGVKDCSGSSRAPGVWKNAVVGEPATVANGYSNYLFADKDSLIRHDVLNQYGKQVPKYPGIHGLYKRKPVVKSGAAIPNGWQEYFSVMNSELGAKKQVDVVILLTSVKSPTFAQAVESKWLYGPKNSFTVVIGTDGNTVTWARGVSFSKVNDLKIGIRDELQGKQLSEVPPIVKGLVSKHFKRTPMSDLEYLNKSTTPSTGWMWFLYIFAVFMSLGIGAMMHYHDVFGDERKLIRRRYGR